MSFRVSRSFPLPKYVHCRLWSAKTEIKAASVRKQFKDYFVNDHHHTFVPSSPLNPLFDHTVPFVNAGMNQFKTILQGHSEPPWKRVANYQKCARVGGKHNDLDLVGSDGYHHTFFEMLGNWSFADYSKKDACKLTWDLLREHYKLNPNQMYVTYFGGDDGLKIPADLECREIWLELGVKEDRIIPFGLKDNFWEMGITGPCGPCTEIHVDHVQGRTCAQNRVNAGFPDVTELWNIVFIEYNRNMDGSLTSLRKHHIDTGMGFERLVALLNGSLSNYDTDIFKPLLDAVHKNTHLPMYSGSFNPKEDSYERDYLYRVISDHSRLVTVALADGIFPNYQYKLRWVLRKSFRLISSQLNLDESLLIELTNHVAENLCDVYPEVGNNLPKVHAVISHEADVFKALLSTLPFKWRRYVKEEPKLENILLMGSNPTAILSAYEKIRAVSEPQLPSSLSLLMYESLGMNSGMIKEMCEIVGLKFDEDLHCKELEKYKVNSKLGSAQGSVNSGIVQHLSSANIPPTYDTMKYDYVKSAKNYKFPSINAMVVALISDGNVQTKLNGEQQCGVVLDRTNFYHTAGGQSCDTGIICNLLSPKENFLKVKDVKQDGDYVIHFGILKGCLEAGDTVNLKINTKNRMACMRNHTLAHLINGKIHKLFKAPCQDGCIIEPDFLKLTYNLSGEEITVKDIGKIEEEISSASRDQLPVERYTVNQWEVPSDTIFLPGTLYPTEDIHIVDITRDDVVLSREPCCGTHLHNTSHCAEFCITEVINHSKGKYSICAVSGPLAVESLQNGQNMYDKVEHLSKDVTDFQNNLESKLFVNGQTSETGFNTMDTVKRLLYLFKQHDVISVKERELSRRLPYTTFVTAESSLKRIFLSLDRIARRLSEHEVQDAAKNAYFLVHNVQSLSYLDSVLLNKITRRINIPIMLFCAKRGGEVKIRCCVPQEVVTSDFNAELWINEIKQYFSHPKLDKPKSYGGDIPPPLNPKIPDPALVSTLSSLKTHPNHIKNSIKDAMDAANNFARRKLPFSS